MIRAAAEIMITRDSGPFEKADVQKGLAVGISMFWHSEELKELPIKAVESVESIPAFPAAFNMPAMHFSRLKKGKIYEIEAIGLSMTYSVKSGW